MAASTGDKITDVRNAARPNSARATGTRSAGGASLACDNLAGWPTASKVHFVTYQINSSSVQVAGTQLDCYGIVTGNTIGSITVVDGTDTGNSVNDVVEMLPTAAWGQDLADALTTEHNRAGKHTAITATSLTTTGNSSIGGNETVTGNQSVTGNLAITGTTTLTGATTITALSNPYKFSVYRNTAWNTGTGSQFNVVNFDTKTFDTSSNVDIVTNKGRFTAPVAGFYQFEASVGTSTTNIWLIAGLYKNGSRVKTGQGNYNAAGAISSYNTVTGLLQLAANDYVEVYLYSSGASQGGLTGASEAYFDGFLVSVT